MTFENVKLEAAANVYFDGKVSSRTFYTSDGERKTLGFMLPGDYEFGTAAAEKMEVLSGEIEATLPGEDSPKVYGPGEAFEIPANSKYRAVVSFFADYLCSYND